MSSSQAVQPVVEHRAQKLYVGITESVTLETFDIVERRLAEVLASLAAEGVEAAGPPFFRYRVIDMFRQLEVETGVPVAVGIGTAGDVRLGALPEGRYVTYTHIGPPDTHIDVITAVFDVGRGTAHRATRIEPALTARPPLRILLLLHQRGDDVRGGGDDGSKVVPAGSPPLNEM